jgi:predicted dehydrogenase
MKTKQNKILRVAIGGQGRSGYSIHANWLREAADKYRIVAVADPLAERRRDAEREFGARSYVDYAEMLDAGGFDIFVNALPTPLHVPGTLRALKSGCHVLCEKPMAPTLRDYDRMVAAAKRARRILAPFQNNRCQPFFLEMRKIVKSGVLGRILYVRSFWAGFARRWDWQTFQCNLGGCLFNTGPHAIDQALCFFPERVTPQVFCRMECCNDLGGDADDFCALTLHAPGGPTVEIHISHYLAYPQGDMYSVNGTRGGLSGNDRALRWKYFDWKKAPRQKLWKPWSTDRQYPRETLPWVEKTWSLDEAVAGKATGYTLRSYRSGVQWIYDGLYGAVVHGKKLVATLPQVRRQIAVLEQAHRQNPLPRKLQRWP